MRKPANVVKKIKRIMKGKLANVAVGLVVILIRTTSALVIRAGRKRKEMYTEELVTEEDVKLWSDEP